MTNIYYLTEIGYDKSIETENNLIKIANEHCKNYDYRANLLPINTLDKALNYFKNYGFKVEKCEKILSHVYNEITQNYSIDYFDTYTKILILKSIELLKIINLGQFEYDTKQTDDLLNEIKNAVNKISI